ncbi:MAG: hypothetical protein GY811_16015 [Myxococcales bacterium]|nr:hypothetical protein [Myxococcales bacterium]
MSYFRVTVGLTRVAMLTLAILSLALFLSMKVAVARADGAMMDLGRHLMALSEAGIGRDSRGVVINGQQVGFRVFTSEHEIETVLEFYDDWCRGGRGEFATQEDELFVVNESLPGVEFSDDRSWRDLTMRGVDGDFGFVACMKHGIPGATAEQLGDRVMRFLKSGNLRDVGQFHYAAATRIGDVTRVVAVWTEGDFYPGSMFPAEGDAPGFDAFGVSRPPTGRRMLSAGEIGHGQTLTTYTDSDQSISELAVFYRRDFFTRGWRVLADEVESADLRYFVVQRGSEMRVVSLSQEPGEGASVTIATTD